MEKEISLNKAISVIKKAVEAQDKIWELGTANKTLSSIRKAINDCKRPIYLVSDMAGIPIRMEPEERKCGKCDWYVNPDSCMLKLIKTVLFDWDYSGLKKEALLKRINEIGI